MIVQLIAQIILLIQNIELFLSKNIFLNFFMFFLFLINFLLYKYKEVVHNCDSEDYNLLYFQEGTIDYQISCEHEKIQRIDLKNASSIRSISIFDDTNVIIECPRLNDISDNLIISIYNEPNITIVNHCHFNQIEIYGSPTFNLFNNSLLSVDDLFLINKSYQFLFDYKNVFYTKSINAKSKIQNNYKNAQKLNDKTIKCENNFFNVSLNDNFISTQCGDLYEYVLPYSSLPKYSFEIKNSKTHLINHCTSNDSLDKNINIALISLNLYGESNVTFKNIPKIESIENYTDQDYQGTWVEVYPELADCIWFRRWYDSEFEDMFERGWKSVCYSGKSLLYCCDSDIGPRKINYISETLSMAIIITIIVLIFVLFISNCIIAYVRFKKHDMSDDESI